MNWESQEKPKTQGQGQEAGGTPTPEVSPAPNHNEIKKESLDIAKILEMLPNMLPSEGEKLIKQAEAEDQITNVSEPTSSEDYSS